MNFLKNLLLISVVVLCSASCHDKLELNAPYKEIPSVYAILNPQEKVQYIRVNKIFLGEGDANQMAKVADSINYQPGEITIKLTRKLGGVSVAASPDANVITFDEKVIQTAPGAFNPNQRVYFTDKKLYTTGDYLLEIKNNSTGNVFTATTTAIDSVKGQGYMPFAGPYYPVDPRSNDALSSFAYVDYSGQGVTYKLRYAVNEAKIYQVAIRVHFYDSIGGSPDKGYGFVDYNFNNQYASKAELLGGSRYLVAEMRGSDYFSGIATALSKLPLRDPTTIAGRRTYKAQFFIYSSTQDYADYLEFSSPSLNISQVKPIYSNFTERKAIGIFTFRTRYSVVKEMKSFWINEFSFNALTRPYKFFDSQMRLH